ncbi:protein FolD (Partial), partial [Seminavis robusta]|eukprot:Sro3514_g348780.1 protein FolD (1001) ;mRNA; r:131-3282
MRILATLRERNLSYLRTTAVKAKKAKPFIARLNHDVAVQLDYYMSPQFGGIASALVNNRYEQAGLGQVKFLPTCPPGLEQERVRNHANSSSPSAVTLGTVEQNIFIPTLLNQPELNTTAVGAMFRTSPLCVASLRPLEPGMTIGAHSDTVELLQRIFPQCKVIASPRSTKNADLQSGKVDAIQAYTTTEVPTLERLLNDKVCVTTLEGHGHTKLGYSQLIFAANECLTDDRREITQAFLEATFQGWKDVIQDPHQGVKAVQEAQKMLKHLDDEGNDHWYPSEEFQLEMLQLCNAQVKQTFQGDRYGVIAPRRWNQATDWLLDISNASPDDDTNFALDTTIWQPPSSQLAGGELGYRLMEDAKASAEFFLKTHGRKPSLAVITVGELKRYTHAQKRLQLYSDPAKSWFAKTATGEANGFEVDEIFLDDSITTDELLSQIYKLQKDDNLDGIQLMWPLPDHIDTARVFNAIDLARDVDGIHFVGQSEVGSSDPFAPVTPAAAMELLKENDINVKGKRALVIGRSPIVGSPMAHLLREQGAVVTVAHSETTPSLMEKLVGEVDIIVTAAGEPGLIPAEWIPGSATVVNIGATFDEETDSLVSDVAGDLSTVGCRYSPVPGGIGPLSVPILFQNTAKAAWKRVSDVSSHVSQTWTKTPASIRKSFHFPTYTAALEFADKVNEMSDIMDHHANMTFSHQCVDGVDVVMEFFTFDANELTEKDYDAARVVELVYGENAINMADFTYDLKESSIAVYPADPRGSSKLLHLSSNGQVKHYATFSETFTKILPKGAHIIFNESRVLDARLFVEGAGEDSVELMILDLGSVKLDVPCTEVALTAMLRVESVDEGDVVKDKITGTKIVVEKVLGVWKEDEKSDGNGMECIVRIHSDDSVDKFLDNAGSTPIPPYFQREAEASDKEAYNNVYASTGGSVAAPTAGLHFTEPVLESIGADNISYVTLHVGAGTFQPVVASDARDHAMHAESFCVSVHEIKRIVAASKAGKPLVV